MVERVKQEKKIKIGPLLKSRFKISREDKISMSSMSREDRRHYLNMMLEGQLFSEEMESRRSRRQNTADVEE